MLDTQTGSFCAIAPIDEDKVRSVITAVRDYQEVQFRNTRFVKGVVVYEKETKSLEHYHGTTSIEIPACALPMYDKIIRVNTLFF